LAGERQAPDAARRPLVSIVIPAYNGSRTIVRTLGSLRQQDYPHTEWIIIDDGSSDGTAHEIERYIRGLDGDATFLQHAANQGISRTLNEGLAQAAGEFVLIIHQDIELLGRDWISRAISAMEKDGRIAVVTCDYGLPAPDDLTFVKRAFGFLRRQIHTRSASGEEFVSFTEFKCDLLRKSAIQQCSGFPTRFRMCGEDIALSCTLRLRGWKILKDYRLRSVQRFAGAAETLRGNLHREFRFGQSNAGVFLLFRSYALRGHGLSPYSRTRFRHRLTQPLSALGILLLVTLVIISPSGPAWIALGVLLASRFLYYAANLWPPFHDMSGNPSRALGETFAASTLGLVSDLVFTAGIVSGVMRTLLGAPL